MNGFIKVKVAGSPVVTVFVNVDRIVKVDPAALKMTVDGLASDLTLSELPAMFDGVTVDNGAVQSAPAVVGGARLGG